MAGKELSISHLTGHLDNDAVVDSPVALVCGEVGVPRLDVDQGGGPALHPRRGRRHHQQL